MKGYYYLNFSDLSEEAQEQLLRDAIEDLIEEEGLENLREEASVMNIDFDTFIRERAERHMYSFNFVFNI
mgnify:FL=1